MICAKAIDPEHTPDAVNTLDTILIKYQYSGPLATRIAKILRGCGNNMGQDKILYVQFAIAKTIATRQPHDDSWYILASNELGFPETSLRDYAAQGDSLSLAILIHIIHQQFIHFWKLFWWRQAFSSVVATASNFDVKGTSPELQHKFCALWNQIVNKVQDSQDLEMTFLILRRIRNVFLALHQDTDSAPTRFSASTDDSGIALMDPSSYPVCKVPGHSTPHIHGGRVSMTIARTTLHGPDVPVFVTSLTSPDPPSLSTHAPLPVNETAPDALPLDNQISAQGSDTTQPTSQTTAESRKIPPTSLSPVTARTTQRIVGRSSRTMHLQVSASEVSTCGPPPQLDVLPSPLADVAVGHNALGRTPSGDLNVPSSPSLTVVLDGTISPGLV